MIVVLKLLANIEQIRGWIPSYIGGATGLYEYAGNELSQQCLENLGILLGYVILLCIIDYWVYKKIDLSR